jgi:hypothetical protein
MTERLQTTLMIAAILLASAFVTATTWAGLRLVTSSTFSQRTATVTPPGPPIHAYLMPAHMPASQRLPYPLPVHPPRHSR